MRPSKQIITEFPLKIVGSNNFGRYSKISGEQTFNMIISDVALVPYAGYKKILTLVDGARGRNIHSSLNSNLMITVTNDSVYSINNNIIKSFIGNLQTTQGAVFVSENNNGEIAITDGVCIYVYNYLNNTFKVSGTDFIIDFIPGFITFQNGRLICTSIGTNQWRLSELNNALSWPPANSINPPGSAYTGLLQTKPDKVQAPVRFPGRGNLLFVLGKSVTEPWTDVGAKLFPYLKSSSYNIDYGCLNPQSIAANEDTIVWLASNETSGVSIMFSNGSEIQRISNDGLDFKFSQLTNPQDCSGFLFRQDGHLIYQFTFKTDNLSYIYDFNTKQFFTVTDENLNYHIAARVVLYNNKYYFVSYNDGNLYEFGTQFTKIEYDSTHIYEIPRIRITPPMRFPTQRPWIGRSLGFTMENGQPNVITTTTFPNGSFSESSLQRVDLSISTDGAVSFGNVVSYNMNPTGSRKSLVNFQRLGWANDVSYQLRFYGLDRFVAFDGVLEAYQ